MKLLKGISGIFAKSLVFTYIFIFPFGQLLRLEFNLGGKMVPLLGVDLIAALSIIYLPFLLKPKFSKYILSNFFKN